MNKDRVQPLAPDAAEVEVARGTGSELVAAVNDLDVLFDVRASTRDRVVGALQTAVRTDRPGPVAAVATGAGTADELGLRRVQGQQWALTARQLAVPADRCLLGRLARGVVGLVPHAVRSPLVRAQGAVTLARRAWSHGRHDELDGELRRLATVTDEALSRADGQAEAIRRLVAVDDVAGDAPPPPGAVTAGHPTDEALVAGAATTRPPTGEPGRVDAAVDAAALLDVLAWEVERSGLSGSDGGAASTADTDYLGGAAPVVAVVVVPQLDAVPVAALRRLVAHLGGVPTVAGIQVVLPGASGTWPPETEAEPSAMPRPMGVDPPADLSCARAWLDTATGEADGAADGGVIAASAEVAALRRCGVATAVLPVRGSADPVRHHDDGPAGWSQLALPAARLAQIGAAAPGWPWLLRSGVEAVLFVPDGGSIGPDGQVPAADASG